jgi:hypothetical protein
MSTSHRRTALDLLGAAGEGNRYGEAMTFAILEVAAQLEQQGYILAKLYMHLCEREDDDNATEDDSGSDSSADYGTVRNKLPEPAPHHNATGICFCHDCLSPRG